MRAKKPYRYAQSISVYPPTLNDWSGTSIVSAPASDFQTPDNPLAAEELNWLLQQVTTDVTNVLASVGPGAAQNWLYQGVDWTGGAPNSYNLVAAWDSFNARWLVTGGNSSNTLTRYSSDGGNTWSGITGSPLATHTSNASYTIMAVRPSDGLIFQIQDHFGASGSATYNGSAWTSIATGPITNIFYPSAAWFAGASLFVVVGDNGSGVSKMWTSPDASTWTAVSPAFPSGFTSGTSTIYFTGFTHRRPHLVQSPTRMLAMSAETSNTGGLSSPDGVTWTAFTTPVGSGEYMVGSDYDAASGLFVIVLTNGTYTKVYYSANGTAWTLAASSQLTTKQYTGIACAGSLWVMSSGAGSTTRPVYSTDLGTTWRTCTAALADVNVRKIKTNGAQFLTYTIDTPSTIYGGGTVINGTTNASYIDGDSPPI